MTAIIRWMRGSDVVSAPLADAVDATAAAEMIAHGVTLGAFAFQDADGYRIIIPFTSFVDIVYPPKDKEAP